MKLEFDGTSFEYNPTKILAVCRNYRKHAEEMRSSVPTEPKFFLKPPSSLIGDGGTVLLPGSSERVDHEVELGVVIKDVCRRVTISEAMEHVLGYTVVVDVTARDLQAKAKEKGMPWSVAKGYDTFCPAGPRIVPASELDPGNLDLWLKVNGEFRQRGNTGQMIFPVARLISFISHVMTLEPFDLIATGTPEGVGPMEDGNRIEAGIEGIGIVQFDCQSTRH
jgi:2-keto-4-pentenoate hydratase/2-oxohepta-3-ene-1,7-dioic acid hydratase in catechol pathway